MEFENLAEEESYGIPVDIDRLRGVPLTDMSQVARWVTQCKARIAAVMQIHQNRKESNFLDTTNGIMASEDLLVDSIVTQVSLPKLRKEIDWMCLQHGRTLTTVFYYLDLVALTNAITFDFSD